MKFGTTKKIVNELKEYRVENGFISFAEFFTLKHKSPVDELYEAIDFDPRTMTVENMFSLNEHTKYLAPEVILNAVLKGMRMRKFRDKIIVKSTPEKSSVIECPFIDFSKIKTTKGTRRTPGATILEDSVTFGNKYVKTTEVGKGIKFPFRYNQLKRLKIDILPLYFKATGIRIDTDLQELIVDVCINGETATDENNASVDESAMVIGVDNTTTGITEDDYIRAVVLMSMAGKPVDSMVASDTVTRRALKWDTFKTQLTGKPDTVAKVDIPLPSQLNMFPTLQMTGEKMCLICQELGILEHVNQPFQVDIDLIVSKKIEEAYCTIDVGYSTILRSFRIVIDGSIEYNDNQVLPWLFY